MQTSDILISLEHKYISAMMLGDKTVELRRRPLRVPPGTRIWMYAKMPRGCVQLFATIKVVVEAPPEMIWREYGSQTAVSRTDFRRYFNGAKSGCAIILSDITELCRPVPLSEVRRRCSRFHPPQFFKRLRAGGPEVRLLLGAAALVR